MDVMVVYSSQTGNTRKIANAIFAAIPGDSKDIQNVKEYQGKDANLFFVGFWTDKGDCDARIAMKKGWRCPVPAAWALMSPTTIRSRRG